MKEDKSIEVLLEQILEKLANIEQAKVSKKEYGLILDVDEAAEYTGLTTGKLYQYGREVKDFPTLKEGVKGSRVFFSREGLKQWVEENTGKIIGGEAV